MEMTPRTWEAQRTSFGQAAEVYDRIRPSYPVEALRSALGDTPLDVVDLGAGTGILTRQLLALGHRVRAVEPDGGMRRRLAETTPGASVLAGSAEAIPLPDASVDAAIAGQAYHWFDREKAHAEIARVVRPGGIFVAIWNDRDESTPWVAEYTSIVEGQRGYSRESTDHTITGFGPDFGPVTLSTFHHTTTHTAESLVALLRSRSYYLTATAAERADLERRVRGLATEHPDLRGRAEFPLPYVTSVYCARRSG